MQISLEQPGNNWSKRSRAWQSTGRSRHRGTQADPASTALTGESGQVCPYRLRSRLPDIQRARMARTEGTPGRQLIGEYLRSAPATSPRQLLGAQLTHLAVPAYRG